MMQLATGRATAKNDGDFIVATIPSGGSEIEISFSPHNAIALAQAIRKAALAEIQPAREAEVVEFRRRA